MHHLWIITVLFLSIELNGEINNEMFFIKINCYLLVNFMVSHLDCTTLICINLISKPNSPLSKPAIPTKILLLNNYHSTLPMQIHMILFHKILLLMWLNNYPSISCLKILDGQIASIKAHSQTIPPTAI